VTTNHDDLKRRHQLAAAMPFIAFLSSEGVALRDARDGVPGEPDVVCSSDAGPCGIEIADGYTTGDDATQLWSMARDVDRAGGRRTIVSTTGLNLVISPLIAEPDARLAASLQATLERHCRSRFGMPTYLVLNASHAPLADARDAPRLTGALHIPPDCGYVAVYLCLMLPTPGEREYFQVT
jgi:hypothetical protein